MHTDLARLRARLNDHFFNWTMTYCLDSDIVVLQPYGRLRCIRTESRRELLVRNLSLFISVDIFGSCSDDNKWCGWNRTECDAILNYYHFYLSLENSLCPDYVTEKFNRALAHHAIPVLLRSQLLTISPSGIVRERRRFRLSTRTG